MASRAEFAELRRMPTPDLRRAIDDRIERRSGQVRHDEPSFPKKMAVLAVAAVIAGGALFGLVRAFGGAADDRGTPGSSSIEPLTGEALARSLGLTRYTKTPGEALVSTDAGLTRNGELLTDCTTTDATPVLIVQEVNDGFYCVRGATKLEAWEIGQRLKGHVPTQSELDEMAAELRGNGIGVDDPAAAKIPYIAERINAIQNELAARDTSTAEGAAEAAALSKQLIQLQQIFDDLCAEAGQPEGC